MQNTNPPGEPFLPCTLVTCRELEIAFSTADRNPSTGVEVCRVEEELGYVYFGDLWQ